MTNLLCRLFGHKPVGYGPVTYVEDGIDALMGDKRIPVKVSVTWVCDEVCARCGRKTWWPA